MIALPLRRVVLALVSVCVVMALALAFLAMTGQPASSAGKASPKKYVTGWLPYWNTREATASVVNGRRVFQDASPFVFDADSATRITLKTGRDEWRG